MVSKNNKKLIQDKNRRNVHQRFALRKFNVGLASVLVGVAFSLYGGGQLVAHADTTAPAQNGGVQTGSETGSQKLTSQKAVTLSNSGASQSTNGGAAGASEASSVASQSSAASTQSTASNASQSTAATKGSSAANKSASSAVASTADQKSSSETTKSKANSASSSSDESIQTLNVAQLLNGASTLPASALGESKAVDLNADTVTVNNAKDFYDAIQSGKATTINVDGDIDLHDYITYESGEGGDRIRVPRDIVIESKDKPCTVDFAGISFTMGSDNSVTFKNLKLEGRNYFGLVQSAGHYVFDNIDYQGSQMVYSTRNTIIDFVGNNNVKTVNSYTDLSGKQVYVREASATTDNKQQVIELRGVTGTINFEPGSVNELSTVSGNIIQIDGSGSAINLEGPANGAKGAIVTMNPHTGNVVEGARGGHSRGIYINSNSKLNINEGASLTLNSGKKADDKQASYGIYAGNGSVITNSGDLIVNSDGDISSFNNWDTPIFLDGSATINNAGTLKVNATNLGSYNKGLIYCYSTGTIKLAPHSTFDINSDGTGAVTGVALGSGSKFTSDQPDSFNIDLSKNTNANKSLIKNGTIDFTRVKTPVDGKDSAPLKEVKISYSNNGVPSVDTIIGQTEKSVDSVASALTNSATNYRNAVNFTAAGSDVSVENVSLDSAGKLTGHVKSTDTKNSIYIQVTIKDKNGNTITLPSTVNTVDRTDWTKSGTAEPTSSNTSFQAKANPDGTFTVDLSSLNLPDDDTVEVTADQNYVDSPEGKSVSVGLAKERQKLKDELTKEANVEKTHQFYNDSNDDQNAFTSALSAAQNALNGSDDSAISSALTNLQNAYGKLDGGTTSAGALDSAVSDAASVENSDAFKNATLAQQQAYKDTISAAQKVQTKKAAYDAAVKAKGNDETKVDQNATPYVTQSDVNQKTKAINDALAAIYKSALQKAVNDASNVKNSDDYTKASVANKTAYDSAITAGNTTLTKTGATGSDYKTALDNINNALGKLDGDKNAKLAQAKTDLQNEIDAAKKAKAGASYLNDTSKADTTDPTKTTDQAGLDSKLQAAEDLLDSTKTPNPTPEQLKNAKKDLADAVTALNGNATDTTDLQTAVNNAGTPTAGSDLAKAVNDAKTVLNNAKKYSDALTAAGNDPTKVDTSKTPFVTQKEVEAAKDAIVNAAKKALLAAVNESSTVEGGSNYKNAEKDKQTAYTSAIQKGKDQLSPTKTPNPTVKNLTDALNAITKAKSALDGDSNVDTNKTAAKKAIDDAATTQKQAIDNATNLSDPEKKALKQDVDKKAQTAKDNIDKATTPDEITNDKTKGIKNIQNVTVPKLEDAKNAAKQEIENARKAKTDAINNNGHLSDTEKANLTKQVNDLAKTAEANVNTATTNDGAKTAGDNGAKAIDDIAIPTLADKQASADAAIDAALANKKQQIANANNLSDAEKKDLDNQAQDAANTAKENINNATTDDAVDKAESDGIIAINNVNVPTLAEKQAAAEKAIDQALKAKQDEINKADLTPAARTDLNNKAEKAATDAKTAISQATNDEAITDAEQAGVQAINGVKIPSLTDQKNTADAAIEAALAAKKVEIQNAAHLTDDEKNNLTDAAQKAADQGKAAVDAATNANAISQAEAAGVLAVNDVHVPTLDEQKTKAKQEIADALKAKTNEIKAATNLSTDEQQKLKDAANKAAGDANKAIDAATNDSAINTAVSDGIKAINNVNVPSLAAHQSAAIAEIKAAQDAKIDDIKKANYLTSDESQKLTDQVNKAADDAVAAIKAAKTNDAVDAAKTTGLNNISKISIPAESQSKTDAKGDIDKVANDKDNAIDANKNLNNEEKNALKDQVKKAADEAEKNIDNAKTDADVTKAENDGKKAIDNIKPSDSTAKTNAKNDIDEALNKKKNEISNANNLTQAEKDQLTKQATDAANKAKNNIDKATTNADVDQAKNDGIKDIDDVKVPSIDDAKSDANKAIDNALKNKQNDINNAKNLTQAEKDQLTKQATDAANKAKDNINKATTNDAVNNAESDGINAINGVHVPSLDDKKSDAKSSIDNAKKAKDDEIDSAKNLTPAKKADLKKQVQDAADAAKSNIDKATNDSDVNKAETNGVKAINDIHIPSLNDQKNQAKDAIADALAKKQAEINNAANLAPDEKSDLNNQAQQAADDANKNIDAATDDAGVNKAEQDGLNNINGIHVPSLADKQNEAKAAIDAAKKAKDDDIDNAKNLSDADKSDLKQKVDDAANAAKNAIDAATNDAAVKQAEDKGISDINNIVVPSIDAAKKSADDAIDDALNKKQDEINKSNLPQSQKDDLNKQAQDAAKTAKDNIAKATNDNDVTKAQNDGVKAIENINVPTTPAQPTLDQQKSDANKAIDDALNKKQNEINSSNLPQSQKDDLNKQAEDAANTAKDNIAKATNANDVTKAQNDGVKAIDSINVPTTPAQPTLDQQKSDANKAIDDALNKKQNEINSSNLPQSHKDDLNKQAEDAANKAKDQISKATNAGDVTNAKDDGVDAINGIHVPTPSEVLDQQKSDADKAIDDALNKKQNEINSSNLPQSQKDDLTKQAQDAANTAKDNINKATNADDVTTAQNDGVKAIDDIDVPTTPVTPVNPGENLAQHKSDADKTIDKALADKQNEINNSNLSDDQKADLNKQAEDAANTAKDNITKATTADGVSNAVFDGVKAINDVKVPSASEVLDQQKSDADKQIDDALSQKTDQINADSSLNDNQKTELINKANDYASQAKDAINNATDPSAIRDALNQGLANIQNLSSADIETNDNQNNGNNSGNQNGNGNSENVNNGNAAINGAAGELNGNAGAANANTGAGANANSAVANGSNAASLNNGSLNAMAHAVKSANANANTNSKKLPQTGNQDDNALGLMGLAAAGLVGLFGMAAKSGKKED